MKRGYAGLIEILAALRDRPLSVRGMHAVMADPPGPIPLSANTRRLYDAGLLHIAAWEAPPRGIGQPIRLYGFGPGDDAAPPRRVDGKPSRMANKMRPVKARGNGARTLIERFAAMWEALCEPTSASDVAAETALGTQDVRRAIYAMRQAKLVRIAEWERGRCAEPTALYVQGAGRDAPRPKPFSERQYHLRRIERRKAMQLHQRLSFINRNESNHGNA